MNLFDGLLGAIGFLTTLPAGKTDRFVQLQKRTYLFPVAGVLIGIILGVIATILMVLLPDQPDIFSVLMIISIYCFTGFNHQARQFIRSTDTIPVNSPEMPVRYH